MDDKKLQSIITIYEKKFKDNSTVYLEEEKERNDRIDYYKSFTREKLVKIDLETLTEYIGKLWSMRVWGNKEYIVSKIYTDNPHIGTQIGDLLYGKGSTEERWDLFSDNVKGLGHAAISELLGYIYPNDCVVFNKTTLISFEYLGVDDLPKYTY